MDAVITREQIRPPEAHDAAAPAAGAARGHRRAVILAGSLFIVGDVAGVLSVVASGSLLLMGSLAVAELVIAVWLIVKGLDEKALEESPA